MSSYIYRNLQVQSFLVFIKTTIEPQNPAGVRLLDADNILSCQNSRFNYIHVNA